MSRELLQQSLKLLIAYQDCTMDSYITNKCGLTIQALKQELAKPEQEPVAWLPKWAHDRLTGQLGSVSDPVTWGINTHIYAKSTPETIPLYTTPPRKEWVGLTDDEMFEFLSCGVNGREDINNIEETLRRKNT